VSCKRLEIQASSIAKRNTCFLSLNFGDVMWKPTIRSLKQRKTKFKSRIKLTHDQHTNQVFKINSLLNFRIVHCQWQISWFWGNMEFSGQKNVWHWYAYQRQRNSKFLVLPWIMLDFHYRRLWSRATWDIRTGVICSHAYQLLEGMSWWKSTWLSWS